MPRFARVLTFTFATLLAAPAAAEPPEVPDGARKTVNSLKEKFRQAVETFSNENPPPPPPPPRGGGTGKRFFVSDSAKVDYAGDLLCHEGTGRDTLSVRVASVRALRALKATAKAAGIQDVPELYESDVHSAMAALYRGKRIIMYNPQFIAMLADSQESKRHIVSAVIAHELGHHTNGHTIEAKGDAWLQEYQADYFSGFALGRMGLSLDEAQSALTSWAAMTAKAAGNREHPPTTERLAQVARGWKEGRGKAPSQKTSTNLWGNDLRAAANARLEAGGIDPITEVGMKNLLRAGELIAAGKHGAARAQLYRAETVPELKAVATWWRCRTYALENNPYKAEDCFKAEGIDPRGRR